MYATHSQAVSTLERLDQKPEGKRSGLVVSKAFVYLSHVYPETRRRSSQRVASRVYNSTRRGRGQNWVDKNAARSSRQSASVIAELRTG